MKRNVMIGIGFGLCAASGLADADVSYATYAGFVSRDAGQQSLCMTVGPQISQGFQVVMEPCDASSPTVYATALDQLQINLTPGQNSTYVCLDDIVERPADVGRVDHVVWDTCGPNVAPNQIPSQSWNFKSALLSNDGTADSDGTWCLTQHGAGQAVDMLPCAPIDRPATATSSRLSTMWMPIWYEMTLAPEVAPGDCLTNLKTNYNSDIDDTQFKACNSRDDQVWSATFLSDFSSYELTNKAGGKALDVFGAQIQLDSQGIPEGVIDMADPNGTLAQYWYFSSVGNGSPNGYSLLVNGLMDGQHMCLDVVGQDPANPNILFGCNTRYEHGSDPAEQIQTTISGFSH